MITCDSLAAFAVEFGVYPAELSPSAPPTGGRWVGALVAWAAGEIHHRCDSARAGARLFPAFWPKPGIERVEHLLRLADLVDWQVAE